MTAVSAGTLLIQDDVLLPHDFDTQSYSHGWRRIPGPDGYAFDRQLRLRGWGCIFLSGELKARACGFSHRSMLDSATARFLAEVRALNFNSAEVNVIAYSSFLGVQFLVIRGHARHVQPGCVLENAALRQGQQSDTDWARG